jgi:hypothetical protein
MTHLLFAGLISWFYPSDAYSASGAYCATNDRLAIGRTLEIVIGKHRARCVDIGTGPYIYGRVADVSPRVRDELGLASAGVAQGKVYLVSH